MNRRAVVPALMSAGLFGASTPAAEVPLGTIAPTMLAGVLSCGAGLGAAVLRRGAGSRLAHRDAREVALGRKDVPPLACAIASGGVLGPALPMTGPARTDAAAASLLLRLEGVATALPAWLVFHENVDRRIALGMDLGMDSGMDLGMDLAMDLAWRAWSSSPTCIMRIDTDRRPRRRPLRPMPVRCALRLRA